MSRYIEGGEDRLGRLDSATNGLDADDRNTHAHHLLGALSSYVDDKTWDLLVEAASNHVQRRTRVGD